MNSPATVINTTLAEVDALPVKRLKVELEYGSSGYDREQSFVIKGLLPEQSFVSMYGPSGSFKSFLALDWACHIASGIDWDGHKVKQGAVLYVAGEGGFGVKKRVRAWELRHKGANLDNLARLSGPVFPANYEEVERVMDYYQDIKAETGQDVKLIILDTLARCYGGNDENSSKDMGAFITGCAAIQQHTGATVLVVHHSGKNAENGGRGSSSLPAALDVEYRVSRDGDDQQALVLTCSKMKDADQPEPKAYDLASVHIRIDSDGDNVNSLCIIPTGRPPSDDEAPPINTPRWKNYHIAIWQSVRSRTAANDPITKALVRDDLKAQGFDIHHFARWLDKLINEGALVLDGEVISMGRNNLENVNG